MDDGAGGDATPDTWTDGALLDDQTAGITLTSCPNTLVASSGARVKTDVNITWTALSGLSKQRIGSLTGKAE
jgi:hypothetical protein